MKGLPRQDLFDIDLSAILEAQTNNTKLRKQSRSAEGGLAFQFGCNFVSVRG